MTTTQTAADERIAGLGKPESELLDVGDVAALLRCSPRSVWRWADGGQLPKPVALGGLRRWRRDELTRWIADGCRPVRGVRGAAK